MTDFKQLLDKVLLEDWRCDGNYEDLSKLAFVGGMIFDFTTYDSSIDEILAKKMLEVVEAILNKTTFEYIKVGDDNYLNYLTMVNMPFLDGKLSWGTSIRGAWFESYAWKGKEFEFDCGRVKVKGEEMEDFLKQLIEWAKAPELLTQN